MNQLLQQTESQWSATGGPRLPVSVHPLVKSSYTGLAPQDQFINNWYSSSLMTLSGFNSGTTGLLDHTMATNQNKVQAYTASVSGSNSSNFFVIGGLLKQRHYTNTLTGTTTASLSAIVGNGEMGVFSIRKIYFDTKMREVATAVTAVKYRTSVLNTTISVFCKCSPDSLNFTLNPTSYSISSISASTDAAIGEIGESFNNILVNSTITASTDRAQYLPGLVSSGAGWSPYITAVGLYNTTNELLAVAKVATPLKKPSDLPLTFKVQIDV